MKFTLSWLKEHLETQASLDEIVEALTALGLEVEGVDNPGARLAAFRVAEVLSAAPHPQADKLQVLTVDAGDGPQQVVCGAPNARAGMKGVFGAPGAYVPGSGITLKVAAIRGVTSHGMMCSSRELELGEDHDGIIELPADAPVGTSYPDYAGLDDPVIDLSVNPNRQDAMGVHGIARDLAAAGLGTLKAIDAAPVAGTFPCPVEIRTDDPDGCPAFYGRVIRGARNGPSPAWLQRRLTAVGQRPISALVDMTNFIMLSHGRPLHVYDLARLDGAVVARKARQGETVEALNGKTYALAPGMTVIADEAQVHDIGGIMGGEHSGVTEGTADILIECAYFDPAHIARTGQALGLASDARSRFERGVDPRFLDDALEIATRMAIELAGGEASAVVRAGTPPVLEREIAYRPNRCAGLGGLDVAEDRQVEILEALGFTVDRGPERWTVTAPSWRRDVEGEADIVEEVIRVEGLDKVVSMPLPRAPGVARPTATPAQLIERHLRRTAAARGLDEAVTWSFIAPDEAAQFGGAAFTLANPISEDMKAMRPSLLPGLIAAARRNQARGADGVRLFELGRRYRSDGEPLTLGLLLTGGQGRHWRAGRAATADWYDAKAEALALLAAAGAPVDSLQVAAPGGAAYHPGRSAKLMLGKAVLAEFGELHPRLLKAFDLDGAAAGAELYLDALPVRRAPGRMRGPFAPPALQAVTRDFAFLVPAALDADRLLRAVRGADKAAIAGTTLFDLFTGAGVPEGEKSLAVEIVLQPTEKSFTEAELKAIAEKVVAAAAKLGARLRD